VQKHKKWTNNTNADFKKKHLKKKQKQHNCQLLASTLVKCFTVISATHRKNILLSFFSPCNLTKNTAMLHFYNSLLHMNKY